LTIAADDVWVPLQTELEIEAGSALDFSALGFRDGPCGSRGRVIATADGHFAYAGDPATPRRFYGVNLCFTALYQPKELTDRLLDRLVRLGYNTVRIHHYEFGLTDPIWKRGFDWSPASVDRLDYLMAGCAERGLWITTDLYVSRPVPGTQIGLSDDKADAGRFKSLVPVHEPACRDWAAFARKFLDRVNPYTGRRVAEEPALAWISLINEPPLGDGLVKKLPQWLAAWNRWLAARYPDRDALDLALGDLRDTEDPAAGTVAPPDDLKSGMRRARVAQLFLAETEQAMVARMRAFLHDELRCPALLTDLNCSGPAIVPLQLARADFDYVDDHFYVDHPVGRYSPPLTLSNANPLRAGAPGAFRSAATRLWGKPFVVSEYNYVAPGKFRGMGALLTGAMAALQDWDALWRFDYANKDSTPCTAFAPAPIDLFELAGDPLQQASDRAALFLFLRGDMRAAPRRLTVELPRAVLRQPPARLSVAGIEECSWLTRVGSIVTAPGVPPPADAVIVPHRIAFDPCAVAACLCSNGLDAVVGRDLVRSETGEISFDRQRGQLCIDTPRTAGGYANAGQAIVATNAGVRIDGLSEGATIFVSSLDDRPIRAADRLLVTHLTDLQNTGARYAELARQTLLDWGGLPHLVHDGQATVRLTVANPAAWGVWALATSGRRRERIGTRIERGELIFTARVRGPDGARMLYEAARREW